MKKEEDKRRWKRLAFESEPTNVSKRGLCLCVCVCGTCFWCNGFYLNSIFLSDILYSSKKFVVTIVLKLLACKKCSGYNACEYSVLLVRAL
mgnify:CR=1 FL=1